MSHAPSEAEFYLHPGRVFATAEPRTLRTVLGSCVAICLFDPELPAGGMNHYLLPDRIGGDVAESPRFAAPALARLLASMQELGSPRSRLQAKVFGGASVLRPASGGSDLGARNVARAFELLAGESIPVINHDVGGSLSRKLLFRTHDGAAFIRRL